jgi:hypothetical protein
MSEVVKKLDKTALVFDVSGIVLSPSEPDMSNSTKIENARMQAGQVFTPGSPVNERDLFSGRIDQFSTVIDAVTQRGYHAVMFGERGVGKTSLANIISTGLQGSGSWLVPRVTCDAADTFSTLWRKAFRDVIMTRKQPGLGFAADDTTEHESLVNSLPEDLTPDHVRRVLSDLARGTTLLVVFDEFDRIRDVETTLLIADTIKALSDYAVAATILLIGVADSVGELIAGHASIERALVQIPMPRMSKKEITQIVTKGAERLEVSFTREAIDEISSLSQGLPYITHLLSLHSVRAALSRDSVTVSEADVLGGMNKALEQWQQSIKTAYYEATRSQQPGNIFKEVLLACALADVDELGYFTAAAVRQPLRIITNRNYDIPNFARHLKELSEAGRGELLQRVGETRRLRYRFTSPIMRPYIVIRGVAEGLIDRPRLRKIEGAQSLGG